MLIFLLFWTKILGGILPGMGKQVEGGCLMWKKASCATHSSVESLTAVETSFFSVQRITKHSYF